MDANLIGPCGVNCAVCKRYLATKKGLLKEVGLPACIGCRPRGKECTFIKQQCASLREGRVGYCFECGDFPCRRLQTLDRRYRTRYGVDLIENSRAMRQLGIDRWLQQEEIRWRCPYCGGTVSMHDRTCYDCRREVPTRNGGP